MARFNKAAKSSKVPNYEGSPAYKQTDKFEFASILLTSFLKDQFYRSADQTATILIDLISKIKDKKFVAKTAIYARTKFGMRSVSHLVAGELTKHVKGQNWTKKFYEKIVYRPDDMLEIISYYGAKYGKPFPNAMKKGFAKALEGMKEYQLAKYRGEGKDVSMVDLVNLVHPKNTEALAKLMKGDLKPADTWEVKLTQAGQKAESEEDKVELKKDAWTDLIMNEKLGYFALLRNLRNILGQCSDEQVIDKALSMLTDPIRIKNSLVLPFRYTTALQAIEGSGLDYVTKTIKAINKAVDISTANVPKFEGKTLVVLDESGSMQGKPAEIGSLFSAIMVKAWGAELMTFSDAARYRGVNPDDSTISIARSIKFSSGGTNFHSIFTTAKKKYDRIIILSDMQGWMVNDVWSAGLGRVGGTPDKAFAEYKAKFDANPKIYSFDLQGYGTLQFPEPNVFMMAGFSDKVFDVMALLETDRDALLTAIDEIEL